MGILLFDGYLGYERSNGACEWQWIRGSDSTCFHRLLLEREGAKLLYRRCRLELDMTLAFVLFFTDALIVSVAAWSIRQSLREIKNCVKKD